MEVKVLSRKKATASQLVPSNMDPQTAIDNSPCSLF